MINLSIPGFKEDITLHHLVLDFNGTLAVDGILIKGVKPLLTKLSKQINVHVFTGDTLGTARKQLKDMPCKITLLTKTNQAEQKRKHLQKLKPATCISIGNGRNDRFMLKDSAIGIVLVQKEGGAAETIMAADIVCTDILTALEIVSKPSRLMATLRN
jgi:P-type E1-E2 ATPase